MNGYTVPCAYGMEDVCALPLARRLAAMMDRDPDRLRMGDRLPRGWHVMLFNTPTPQSRLRGDGVANLGVDLPDIGLPRLMMGGRRIEFLDDIPIGAPVRRQTRQGDVQLKQGRSGRFALLQIEHRISVGANPSPAIIETSAYVLREAIAAIEDEVLSDAPSEPTAEPPGDGPPPHEAAQLVRSLTPDERLLFRYSAITDNPHRVHYDLPYARDTEGYPALLVNGTIPAMFLLEMFRDVAGREPASFRYRNTAPMYCGQTLTLAARAVGDGWRLWAQDAAGTVTLDAHAA